MSTSIDDSTIGLGAFTAVLGLDTDLQLTPFVSLQAIEGLPSSCQRQSLQLLTQHTQPLPTQQSTQAQPLFPHAVSAQTLQPQTSLQNTLPNPTLTQPQSRNLFDVGDDFQLPVKPSHDYGMFRQQVGVPMAPSVSTFIDPLSFDAAFGFPADDLSSSLVFNGMNFQPQRREYPAPAAAATTIPFPSLDTAALPFMMDPLAKPSHQPQVRPVAAVSPFLSAPAQHSAQISTPIVPSHTPTQLASSRPGLATEPSEVRKSLAPRKSVSGRPLDAQSEEIISRVINQIRENSKHTQPDGAANPSLPLQTFKLRKEEDDMDEDERLLASEEGKKLTSKERRQLRNKVSARAFRSRRKEYIGHLENEVMSKTAEANNLKRRNAQLAADNARSHNFIALLLRHPAFQPFLEDLSNDPVLTEPMKTIIVPEVPSQTMIPESAAEESSLSASVSTPST